MSPSISVITIGVADLARSKRFYGEGFGWSPVWENAEIAFYQMNGLVLGTWLASAQAADTGREPGGPGAFALAHNVRTEDEVRPLMARLAQAGGAILKPAGAAPHGGLTGYVTDPDGHAWEIAYNPAWRIDDQGHVTFGV